MNAHHRTDYDSTRETHDWVLALPNHVIGTLEVCRGIDEGRIILR